MSTVCVLWSLDNGYLFLTLWTSNCLVCSPCQDKLVQRASATADNITLIMHTSLSSDGLNRTCGWLMTYYLNINKEHKMNLHHHIEILPTKLCLVNTAIKCYQQTAYFRRFENTYSFVDYFYTVRINFRIRLGQKSHLRWKLKILLFKYGLV